MALWTDIIDPAELTGYARASLADYEARKGTLARWLPNRDVADIVVRFVAGQSGLVETNDVFRAYDAEPVVGKAVGGKRVTLELPALGRVIPVSEYNQLRARNSAPSDESILRTILNTTDTAVRAVSDAIERLRGTVLVTGKATVTGFMDDDFGRSVGHTVTAGTVWSNTSADVLGDITTWADTYRASNGVDPGTMLISTAILRAMAAQPEFATQLVNGASRPATIEDVRGVVGSALPNTEIVVYDRNVLAGGSSARVVASDKLLFLPPAVETDAWQETELGATFWGQTLSSSESDWGIEDVEQPGLVAGVYRHETPPMIAEVHSDAIALPVLANADLSFAADVL